MNDIARRERKNRKELTEGSRAEMGDGRKVTLEDRYGYRVLSRSTSVTDNLVNDVERAVTVALLNATRYGSFVPHVSL